MKRDAPYWKNRLELVPHPEGGSFREVYRSQERVGAGALPARYQSARTLSTTIYFLLESGQFSAFHILKSDEVWHYYDGCPLRILIIDSQGNLSQEYLGPGDPVFHSVPQLVVERDIYFAAQPTEPESYTLAGCTMAPGFEFEDFRMPERSELLRRFPHHAELIRRYTR